MSEIFKILNLYKSNTQVNDKDTIAQLQTQYKQAVKLKLTGQARSISTLIAEKKYLALDLDVAISWHTHYKEMETFSDPSLSYVIVKDNPISEVRTKGLIFTDSHLSWNQDTKVLWLVPVDRYTGRMSDAVFSHIAKKEFRTYHIGIFDSMKNIRGLVSAPLRTDPVLLGFNGAIWPSEGLVHTGMQRLYALYVWGEDLEDIPIAENLDKYK